jgi:hypothetical protein
MSASNPLLQALAAIPVAPFVAAHSVIAVRGNGPIETGDDGVVSYQSAHIPEAVSELVFRSGHSVQSNPLAVNEVRRILLPVPGAASRRPRPLRCRVARCRAASPPCHDTAPRLVTI